MGSFIWRATLALVFLSFIIGIVVPTVTAATKGGPQAPGDGVRRITPDELREALKKGKAVLIDVRGEESYKAGHIKGARLIPASEIGSRLNELPKDKLIATYCS
jgi:3-mercaptopyruvate sulfurtransferase SseA